MKRGAVGFVLLVSAVLVLAVVVGYSLLPAESSPMTFEGLSVDFASILERVDPDDIYYSLPKDTIPPLDSPKYDEAEEASWLQPWEFVLGIEIDGDVRAYPLNILNYHEIVNDRVGGELVVISYCPLCRTGLVFSRLLGNMTLSFGNSGALYEADLVMYDRQSESLWWQMLGLAIDGPLRGSQLRLLPSVVTRWGQWREMHPETLVLSLETGYDRRYFSDSFVPYDNDLERLPYYPHSEPDPRLQPKAKVVGVSINGEAKAYPITGSGETVINDVVGGVEVTIFIDEENQAGAVYLRKTREILLTFRVSDGEIVDDQTLSTWSLSGLAVNDPLTGSRLTQVQSWGPYWFAWASAFPETELLEG